MNFNLWFDDFAIKDNLVGLIYFLSEVDYLSIGKNFASLDKLVDRSPREVGV